jgi:hypothetical protein
MILKKRATIFKKQENRKKVKLKWVFLEFLKYGGTYTSGTKMRQYKKGHKEFYLICYMNLSVF